MERYRITQRLYSPAGLDHGVCHPQLPPDHATALQHRRQGACEGSDMMLRGPCSLPSVFTGEVRCNGTCSRPPPHRRDRLFCMGGSAQFRWTAQRHVQVHRRTTVVYPTAADAMIETVRPRYVIGYPLCTCCKTFLTVHEL